MSAAAMSPPRLIPASRNAAARAWCVAKPAVLAGAPWFDSVFRHIDPAVTVTWQFADGAALAADDVVCRLHGPARAIVTGERSALNFLQTCPATATITRRYVTALGATSTRILDTRKTVPGLRSAQKYAVRAGGGVNHRMGLFDAILIKENHIAAAGSISAAVRALRASHPALRIEVEVENMQELDEALAERCRNDHARQLHARCHARRHRARCRSRAHRNFRRRGTGCAGGARHGGRGFSCPSAP